VPHGHPFGDYLYWFQQVQVEYTFGPDARDTTYHVDVLLGALTRNIDVRFADVRDEITSAFTDEIPPSEGRFQALSCISCVRMYS
jgi:hypothetical protein